MGKQLPRRAHTARAVLILAIVLTLQMSCAAYGQQMRTEGQLFLQDLQVPKGDRIESFEIHLTGSVFKEIIGLPDEWSVQVRNEGSGAVLEASALSESSPLTEKAIEAIGIRILKSESHTLKFAVSGMYRTAPNVTGTRRIPLSIYNFAFVERDLRRRLN